MNASDAQSSRIAWSGRGFLGKRLRRRRRSRLSEG